MRCWEAGDEAAVVDPGRAERPSAASQPQPPLLTGLPTPQLTSTKPCSVGLF